MKVVSMLQKSGNPHYPALQEVRNASRRDLEYRSRVSSREGGRDSVPVARDRGDALTADPPVDSVWTLVVPTAVNRGSLGRALDNAIVWI